MKNPEFSSIYSEYSFEKISSELQSIPKSEIEFTIQKIYFQSRLDFQDYKNLISPNAIFYLEELATISKEITEERFGKTIQLFMPMYLSNECRSSCLYCGFSFENKIPRKTLNQYEIRKEAEVLSRKGIQHILILTGEDYVNTSVHYISHAIKILKEYFSSVSIEVYPLKTEEYKSIINSGADSLILYQETYDEKVYKQYHVRGVKKDMIFRLNAPSNGGHAGFRKIGLGALLGLSNPNAEMFFLGLHAEYLLKNFWQTSIQFSLPRMRPNASEFKSIIDVPDRQFLQFIFALRIYFRDAAISLSTRESIKLRDNLIGLGITSMSAESKTEPGGYSLSGELEQFETEDKRSLDEIKNRIREKGYDPILKDFDSSIL
jgi:2-iminoacetate synthase